MKTSKISSRKTSFFMLLTVKCLGHENVSKTIEPNQPKIAAIRKILSPTAKIELMRFIGSTNFHSKFIEKLHVNLKPLYELLHDNFNFLWNFELETLFQQIKISITKDFILTLPNTYHPIFITVDSSFVVF